MIRSIIAAFFWAAFIVGGLFVFAAQQGWAHTCMQIGVASWYEQGSVTASGARFRPDDLTAAHRTLPFGSRVTVYDVATGRSVTVTVLDRGPFVRGRIIDLSRAAAIRLGMIGRGTARVCLTPQ